jgi:subtilase family serine protease
VNPTNRRRAVALTGIAAVLALGAPAVAASNGSSSLVPALLRQIQTIPSWVAAATPVQTVAGSDKIGLSFVLQGRNQAALQRFDAAVSDPSSPLYRHFLTSAQYAATYAPAAGEVAKVEGFLRGAGFTTAGTSRNSTLIEAEAPASVVGKVFATSFGLFQHESHLLREPLSTPTLPAVLAGSVSAVAGLAQTPAKSNAVVASPAFVNARPCSSYYGQRIAKTKPKYFGKRQAYVLCGYRAKQIRSAYGVNHVGNQGAGVSVGIVDAFASPEIASDVNKWSKRSGLPALKSGQLVEHDLGLLTDPPIDPLGLGLESPDGWQPEENLDVEAVHAIAPKATIDYYAALNGFGLIEGGIEVGLEPLITALGEAVEADKVQVISNSWGGQGESQLPVDKVMLDIFTNEAQAEGITIDFSSGDASDEVVTAGARAADFPATSSAVTAVGGTDLRVNKHGKRTLETYWGTQKVPALAGKWDFGKQAYSGGAGGGVSTQYAEPSWQRGIVPNSEATYGGIKAGRVEPDVSMDADTTSGFVIGLTEAFADGSVGYGEYRIGGTSVSCPLFSGLVALAVAANHGKGLGLITPTLYRDSNSASKIKKLFNNPAKAPVSHGRSTYAMVRGDYSNDADPTSRVIYTLRTTGNLGTLHWRKGFDDSTGLGSPKAVALVRALK